VLDLTADQKRRVKTLVEDLESDSKRLFPQTALRDRDKL